MERESHNKKRMILQGLRIPFILCLLLHVCVWQTSSQKAPQPEKTPIRGYEDFNLKMPKFIFELDGRKYTRVFQASYDIVAGHAGSFASQTYKFIKQDAEGRIIIKPGLTRRGYEPLWLGVGNPRRQLDFIRSYKMQGATQPVIQSFLVEWDPLRERLNPTYLTIEDAPGSKVKDINVDKYVPYQFGFREDTCEIIRQYTLPGSLATFVDGDIVLGNEFGKVLPMTELADYYGLPTKSVPGIENASGKQRSNIYSQMASDLEEINKVYKSNLQADSKATKLDNLINEYNEKFLPSQDKVEFKLSKAHLEQLEKWEGDLRERITLIDKKDYTPLNTEPEITDFAKDLVFRNDEDIEKHLRQLQVQEVDYRLKLQKRQEIIHSLLELHEFAVKDPEIRQSLLQKKIKRPEDMLKLIYNDNEIKSLKIGYLDACEKPLSTKTIIEELVKGISDTRKKNQFDKLLTKKFLSGHKTSAYNKEIICQIGDSENVEKATSYLLKRYQSEGKDVKVMKYNYDSKSFKSKSNVNMVIAEDTRITVVGHGDGTENVFKVGGVEATDIVESVAKYVIGEPNKKVGKINILACNTEIGKGIIGREITHVLQKYDISTVLSLRSGLLQVDETGRKQYKIAGTEMEWKYLDEMPLIVRYNQDLEMEYWTKTNDGFKWTTEPPQDESVAKLNVYIEAEPSPIHTDIAEGSKKGLLSGIYLGDASGELHKLQLPKDSIGTSSDISDLDKAFLSDGDNAKVNVFQVVDENEVQASLVRLEANQWAGKLSEANLQAVQDLPHPEKWVPVIDTAVEDNSGRTKLMVMNVETFEKTVVHIKSDAYFQFKQRTKKYGMSVRSLPKFTKTSLLMTGSGSAMGIGFFIKSIIDMARAKKLRGNATFINENQRLLAKSLKIHSYIGLAEGSFSAVSDSIEIAEFALGKIKHSRAVGGVVTLSKHSVRFLKFSNVLGKVSMGVGALGGLVGLGFSAYQLHHAQTYEEKVEYGLQVAFDVVGSGIAISSIIVTAVASAQMVATVSTVAGPVGFVVAIVGFLVTGITQLVFEFKGTRKAAGVVGEYFFELDRVYSKHGYEFDYQNQTLHILPHAIVEMIDVIEGRITLDTQYIYRTRHGRSGSGKKNYFFLIRDTPVMVEDKDQAINIREGIGYGEKHHSLPRNAKVIILPIVPKSYISYEYKRLPFCTAMHDKGFDVIRRLENDYRFDYDFYVVPGEKIIAGISQEYVKTTTTLKLSNAVKTVIVPPVPTFLHNWYTFTLETTGTEHLVILTDGFSFILNKIGKERCTWFLDISNLTEQSVSFNDISRSLHMGTTSVSASDRNDLLLFDAKGGMIKVNPTNGNVSILEVKKPATTSEKDFRDYMKDISQSVRKSQQFITITNFERDGIYIGKAYYEIESETFLYSDFAYTTVSSEFKSKVQMVGKVENNVYFMGTEDDGQQIIWNTDAMNHTILAKYNLFCGNQSFQVKTLGVREKALFLLQNMQNVSLIYMIYPEQVRLISIEGNQEDVYRLGKMCFPSIIALLPNAQPQAQKRKFPGRCVYAQTVPVLPLKQTSLDGISQHFWFYMNDTESYNDNQDETSCNEIEPPIATGIIKPNMSFECEDLTLRDIQKSASGEDVYFFLCEENKTLFYQEDESAAIEVTIPGGIQRIEDFGSTKYIRSNHGGLYLFTETGDVSLAAVTFDVIARDESWSDAIRLMSNNTSQQNQIVILNMTSLTGKSLTAWYDTLEARFVVVSPELNATDVVYLGPTPSHYLVWLYDRHSSTVILQHLMSEEELINMTDKNGNSPVWKHEKQPFGEVVVSSLTRVEIMNGNVFCVNKDGAMFSVDHFGAYTLLGVNKTWLETNRYDVNTALQKLCLQFNASSIITMGHESINISTALHKWYHCLWNSVFRILDSGDAKPVFIGQNEQTKSLFFFVGKSVLEIYGSENRQKRDNTHTGNEPSTIVRKLACDYADVEGKTFVMKAFPFQTLPHIPMIDGMRSLVIAVDADSEVHISMRTWVSYVTIMVTGIGSDGSQTSRLVVDLPPPCDLYYTTVEDGDTIISDPLSDNTMILEDFTPFSNDSHSSDNGAELHVMLCGKDPKIFVTSRPRMANAKANVLFLSIYIYNVILILPLIVCISAWIAWQCRKKRAPSTSHQVYELSDNNEQ